MNQEAAQKRCIDCREMKALELFNRCNIKGTLGRRPECKICQSKRRLRYKTDEHKTRMAKARPRMATPTAASAFRPISRAEAYIQAERKPKDELFLEDIEREAIISTVNFYHGNLTRTSHQLRMSVGFILKKLKIYQSMGYAVPEGLFRRKDAKVSQAG